MGTETTGFMHGADLGKMIDEAERKEDAIIKVEGLIVGKRYHIRPSINCGRICYTTPLLTGDYTITSKRFDDSVIASGTYFTVEGIDGEFLVDDRLIFSYARED